MRIIALSKALELIAEAITSSLRKQELHLRDAKKLMNIYMIIICIIKIRYVTGYLIKTLTMEEDFMVPGGYRFPQNLGNIY